MATRDSILYYNLLAIIICAILLNNISVIKCHTKPEIQEKHIPLFVFGDSIFDPGNNNYIETIGKANYFPYGETFFNYPTGRFCDGRIIPDFIAEYANLPLIKPYLDPENREFKFGVNFASAGSGALVESNQGMTIDLHSQLKYFKNVTAELKQKVGETEAKALLSKGVYVFSIGSNDYVFPFTINSTVLRTYSIEQYVGLVIGNITSVIQEMYEIGARKFAVANLWPLACVPYLRVIRPDQNGSCFYDITPYLVLHNRQVSKLVSRFNNQLKGSKFSLLDFNSFLKPRLDNPSKYGIKEAKEACCGSGPYRGILSCGGKRGVKEYYLCKKPSEYLFFDSGHLTENAYQQFAKQAWNGTFGDPSLARPYTLKALFQFST